MFICDVISPAVTAGNVAVIIACAGAVVALCYLGLKTIKKNKKK